MSKSKTATCPTGGMLTLKRAEERQIILWFPCPFFFREEESEESRKRERDRQSKADIAERSLVTEATKFARKRDYTQK